MSLESMIVRVKARLRDKGKKILHERYVNNNRNYEIFCELDSYLLKWSDEPFFGAAKMVKGYDPNGGIGISIDQETTDHFLHNNYFDDSDIFILYQWTGSKIYYQRVDEHRRIRSHYRQRNGEFVYVVPVKTVISWE